MERRQKTCMNSNGSPTNGSQHLLQRLFRRVVLLHVVLFVLPATSASPSSVSEFLFPTAPTPVTETGPIDDTKCNIEELEQANDSQLFTILHELVARTEFFQHFAVDLEQTCPLSKNSQGGKEEEEFECPSEKRASENGGVPGDPFAALDDHDAGGGGGCSVDAGPGTDSSAPGLFGFGMSTAQSQALNHLAKEGFQSPDQAGAFQWKQQTDLVASDKEKRKKKNLQSNEDKDPERTSSGQKILTSDDEQDCLEIDADHNIRGQQWLPETFWMDMCSHVTAGVKTKIVNLALNPERNTGYNGTHLWNAIYEENCISISKKTNPGNQLFPTSSTSSQPQCFEERVLYRLLSGLHTSTTLSIAKNYFPPSKRKGRDDWTPNPQYFMDHFQDHPEYIRNLHFSYVVLLRALKKATPFLYNYEIKTGNIVQDEAATVLLRRLLDSSILQSCSSVFGAFDETLMFRQEEADKSSQHKNQNASAKTNINISINGNINPNQIELQQSFKGVFQNISSILDCVQCQQCKLHGKMAMLGYGTALKILFIKPSALRLERNEIVAFINTIAKFSQSIREVRELTHLYWNEHQQKQQKLDDDKTIAATSSSADSIPMSKTGWDSWNSVDGAVGAIAALQRQDLITPSQEANLIAVAMESRDPTLLILTKHYFSNAGDADLIKLRDMLEARGLLGDNQADGSSVGSDPLDHPDAIVVGSGLAGQAAALNILDRGGYVILIEKEHLLGGNSNKASSGINACSPNITLSSGANDNVTVPDSIEIFINDTIRSAGDAARPDLVEVLVKNSANAVEWLQNRVGVDLSLKAQLGGHTSKRTHRPSNGMAGAEIIYGISKAIRKYQKTGQLRLLVDTRVTQLLTAPTNSSTDDGKGLQLNAKTVVGVDCENMTNPGQKYELHAPHVIMATGGFASDRRPEESYLSQYRPELLKFPTTAGAFSTGDGVRISTALGADVTSMDQVQIHPTGWVDPADPTNPSKVLAAELMRGVGGILLNDKGQRFCNELGTRAYITDKMLSHNANYVKTGKWDSNWDIPTFVLILSSSAAEDAKKHVDLYSHKGLLKRMEGIDALAEWVGLPVEVLRTEIKKYQTDARKGKDDFGKKTFRGLFANDLKKEVFYAGKVTPVLHYCMGGITIDTEGNVLDTDKRIIPGLHAAGEVTGGVHGDNRLAGNSLLECTVFGSLVGRNLPLQMRAHGKEMSVDAGVDRENGSSSHEERLAPSALREIRLEELQKHNTPEDCWVAIHGVVYDLTDFAEEHPAGPKSILELAGQDGTEAFAAVHNENILEDFDDDRVGIFAQS